MSELHTKSYAMCLNATRTRELEDVKHAWEDVESEAAVVDTNTYKFGGNEYRKEQDDRFSRAVTNYIGKWENYTWDSWKEDLSPFKISWDMVRERVFDVPEDCFQTFQKIVRMLYDGRYESMDSILAVRLIENRKTGEVSRIMFDTASNLVQTSGLLILLTDYVPSSPIRLLCESAGFDLGWQSKRATTALMQTRNYEKGRFIPVYRDRDGWTILDRKMFKCCDPTLSGAIESALGKDPTQSVAQSSANKLDPTMPGAIESALGEDPPRGLEDVELEHCKDGVYCRRCRQRFGFTSGDLNTFELCECENCLSDSVVIQGWNPSAS